MDESKYNLNPQIIAAIDAIVLMLNIDAEPEIKNQETRLNVVRSIAEEKIDTLFYSENSSQEAIREILEAFKRFCLMHDKYDQIAKCAWIMSDVLDFCSKSYNDKMSQTIKYYRNMANKFNNLFWYLSTYDSEMDQKRVGIITGACNEDTVLSYILFSAGVLEGYTP